MPDSYHRDRALIIAKLLVVILSLGIASFSKAQQPFSFGTYGDMPYGPEQLAQFPSLIESLDGANIEFVIHVGDIKSGGAPCTAELLQSRIDDIDAIQHPVIYLPGDNEWTDCWYQTQSTPIEWLSVLRGIAYPNYGESLGTPTMPVAYQPEYPEHQNWSHSGVYFTAVHFVGSDNGLTDFPDRSPEHDEEVAKRIDAAISWLNQSFDEALAADAPAMVVTTHANPFTPSMESNPDYEVQPFDAFRETLALRAMEFEKPVLLLHGDTHTFRFDQPLNVPGTNNRVENVYRLEVFGAPALGWINVSVDPASPGVFSIQPLLITDSAE